MPTYHIHDTAVKLCVWDPHQPPKLFVERHYRVSMYPLDPSYGRDVEILKEEHEGVDFLGSDMPFFLVKSAKDLFFKTRQASTTITKHAVGESQEEQVLLEEGPNISDFSSVVAPEQIHADGMDDGDADSALSTISSSMFADSSPREIEDSAPLRKSLGRKGKPRGWSYQKPKSKSQDLVSKPIMTATPIMVQLELSKKTFMTSIITNDAQDICVNIFVNGEFAYSRVIRSVTAESFTAEQKDQPFGGRRIDTNLEVPWVILPVTQDHTSLSEEAHERSSFEDKWDKVNQLLLQEADEWGRTGKYDMFRAPVGEYLAELSKRPVPQSMKNSGTIGRQAGIIDVVISVGKSVTIPRWSNITEPQRKFPEHFCAKDQQLFVVPEKLNLKDKAQIVADFEREENSRASGHLRNHTRQSSQTQNSEDGYYFRRVTTRKIPLNDSRDESAPAAPMSGGQSMGMQEEPSSSQPLALVMPSARLKRGGSLPAKPSSLPQQRTGTKYTAIPTTPTREQPRHPNKPQFIPQKSYKGPTPSPNGQKQNPWEYLPFDPEKSVGLSTRSKRSKSISASSPDNIRGQKLVDNYLTLRNRHLGALPSTPIERSPRPRPFGNGIGFPPGVSSEIDSSPCRPSTRSDQRSLSMLHANRDVSKENGLGLDGAGDARKHKSDTSIVSENTPTRSSKRKRSSSGSPNTSLGGGASPPILPPKSAKRTNMVSKDNKVSSHSVPRVEKEHSNPPTMDGKDSLAQESMGRHEKSIVSQSQEPNKKQRRPSRAMSARELSSLLTPHKPAMGVNTSFGASFAEASSTRSTRNPTMRQKVASEPKAETSQANHPKVIATYKKPTLVTKGVEGTAKKATTQIPVKNPVEASRNTKSEPPLGTGKSETTKRRTVVGRSAKVKKPEQAVSNNVKRSQKGVESSMTPVETTEESATTQGQKMMTTGSDTKVQSDQPKGESPVLPISYDDFWRDFGGPPGTPEVRSSMSTKPNPRIDPGVPNALNSKPHQTSHRGMNTPTPRSATFTIPKGIETPNTLTHTVSSSATMKYTPETGSTMSFREVPTPTLAMLVPQSSVELPNPASRGQLLPLPNLVQNSGSSRSASRPITLSTTPSASESASRQPSPPRPNLVAESTKRRSASGPLPAATTPTSSLISTGKDLRPPKPSDSADLTWKPNSLCADSILSYATEQMVESWSDKEYLSQSGCAYRATKTEREAVFRASGILMGVRFVLGVASDDL